LDASPVDASKTHRRIEVRANASNARAAGHAGAEIAVSEKRDRQVEKALETIGSLTLSSALDL
jgi:hypothetical protein